MGRSLKLAVALLLVACSSPGPVADIAGGEVDGTAQRDGSSEVVLQTDTVRNEDLFELIEVDPTTDVKVVDVPGPLCESGEGCFLDPCQENENCQSGWCVQHLGAGVCTQTCQEECPPGWSCGQLEGLGPDLLFVCVSTFANLCRPCTTTADCKSTGGAEDACIEYGSHGSFCGGTCSDKEDCPWGFACESVTSVEGSELLQCINETGECPCTQRSVALGLTTSCSVTNDYGICVGSRTCGDEGLSDCSAGEPAAELCNGIDDDCDGEVDEPDLLEGNYVNLCNDGNQCTEDKCMGSEACVNELLESGGCDDENPCTVADHCADGTCLGDPVECNDENPCTDNICTNTGGCEYPPNQATCDDDNPCTVGDDCDGGQCIGTLLPCDCMVNEDCASLEDGDLCNGTLICDTKSLPFKCVVDAKTAIECPGPEETNAICLQPFCEPLTGDCSVVPANNEWLCDDDDACTMSSACEAGECAGGMAINCNDGNICTDDSCDPDSGCSNVPNSEPCMDGNVCTTTDQCEDGECFGGPPLECNDNNICSGQETCDPALGCQWGTPPDCDDSNSCTTDSCDPGLGCQNKLTNCSDNDNCTVDFCVDGACKNVSIVCQDDGNPCTVEQCDLLTGQCAVSLKDCNDNNLCTLDSCVDGECLNEAYSCCDDTGCSQWKCDPDLGWQLVEDPFDDGDPCTWDYCDPWVDVVYHFPKNCDDGNDCTNDICDPVLGECVATVNILPCDDGDVCSQGDSCFLGSCVPGDPLNCDDSNICTDDTCDEAKGCQYLANELPCDDGDACTSGEMCSNLACVGGDELDCDDESLCTIDSCDADEGCLNVSVNCDDQNECTDDDCDGATGCSHVPLANGTACGPQNENSCQQGLCTAYCKNGWEYQGACWYEIPTSVSFNAFCGDKGGVAMSATLLAHDTALGCTVCQHWNGGGGCNTDVGTTWWPCGAPYFKNGKCYIAKNPPYTICLDGTAGNEKHYGACNF
jgi:hypothetical protein